MYLSYTVSLLTSYIYIYIYIAIFVLNLKLFFFFFFDCGEDMGLIFNCCLLRVSGALSRRLPCRIDMDSISTVPLPYLFPVFLFLFWFLLPLILFFLSIHLPLSSLLIFWTELHHLGLLGDANTHGHVIVVVYNP